MFEMRSKKISLEYDFSSGGLLSPELQFCRFVMVQPKRTRNLPNMTKSVNRDVNHQHKQTKQMDVNQSIR